ncbi:ankyrin repeat and LEM domain-containing protein 1 [Dromaius novaehollandiae]|uniref:ankyrin repeat and LEM domain-containing protein 1 n=1 Tax=Dromaius novaehollandiae TaxID=8790 RepID=UPI00311D49A0
MRVLWDWQRAPRPPGMGSPGRGGATGARRLCKDGFDPGPLSSSGGEPEARLGPGWGEPPVPPPQPLACSTLLGGPGDSSSDDEAFVTAAETLPALLRACSLGGSSAPEPELPRLRHVTPRSKSRLGALAARLGTPPSSSSSSSSSSSLLGETPEMLPQCGGPAAPPGHRGALGDGDASDGYLDETGSPDATVLLPGQPGLSPGAGGSGGSSPAVPPGCGCPVGAAEPPPPPLSDATLLRELRRLGADPGPVTALTRRVYARRLAVLSAAEAGGPAGHSPELAAALETSRIPDCADDELALARHFDRCSGGWRWRGGALKSSFNYLLLDPRATQDLPLHSRHLSPAECFRTFVQAIFYVGKGTRARPYCHLYEALSHQRAGKAKACPKVWRILEIWAGGQGVLSVHCFQSAVAAEAYTREACLVEAIGLRALTNQKKGNCYGVAASWPVRRRRRLGVHMLHRAMQIFLAEGERQLRPADIHAGR